MEVFESPLADGWDAWFGAWIDSFLPVAALPLVVVLILLALVGAVDAQTVRRRFWCRLAGREVETEFEARGFVPRLRSVMSCSAFERGGAIACRRRCLDASYRRQWEAPHAPVRGDARWRRA
jgi:hypothetical protein